MPRIKLSSIENIRQRVNIVDVVEPYVSLKRSGSRFVGLSPFNPEKTPSFNVDSDKGFFYCFSSKNGGDLIKFVMLMENLSYPQAIEWIANRFQITLEYEEDGSQAEERTLRAQMFEIYEVATAFYRNTFLSDTMEGRFAREYWERERGFSKELGSQFDIGFAPLNSAELLLSLKRKKFTEEGLVQCGLFYGKDSRSLHPRFNARLMIPIRDLQGRVIAFTARLTKLTPQNHDVEKSKYINSPETLIFSKKQMVFNLDKARVAAKKTGKFLLVEGQLDALRCVEKGIEHVVAPQGSAVSEEQMLLLKRYADGIDCLLDNDRAGHEAALKVLLLAVKCGLFIRFLPLNGDKDPDELLCKGGKPAFDAIESQAQSPIAFAYNILVPHPGSATVQEKQQALQKIFEIIRQCPSSVMQDDCLRNLSQVGGFERSSLEKDFKGQAHGATATFAPITKKYAEFLTKVEDELLLLCLSYPDVSKKISHVIDYKWINTDSIEGRVLLRFLNDYREDLWLGIEHIDQLIENESEHEIIYKLMVHNHHYEHPIEVANKALVALHTKFVDSCIKIHTENLNKVNEDKEMQKQLLKQIRELRKEYGKTPQLS